MCTFQFRSVKVLIVANPANTNALVCSYFSKMIPASNFTCLTRLDEERLRSILAKEITNKIDASAEDGCRDIGAGFNVGGYVLSVLQYEGGSGDG